MKCDEHIGDLIEQWKVGPSQEQSTVDVIYTWKYGGPHIKITICANDVKLCVYNAYVL